MKRWFFILIFSILSVTSLQAQFAKPLRNKNKGYVDKSPFCLGITGSFAANDMRYSAVGKSTLTPYFAPTFGIAAEWNVMNGFAIGLDASYAMRGTNEVFATELLTSFTTTTFSRVRYSLAVNGVEVRMPFAYYFGDNDVVKPYVFVAPRFDLWLNGNIRWERTYDDDSFAPLVYESEVNNATMAQYDIGAVAGLGLCSRIMVNGVQFYVKFDLSYGMAMSNSFSQHEVNEDVAFQGWGDIAHETLGERLLQNVEARLTLLMPLGKRLKDACAFDQRMRKGK